MRGRQGDKLKWWAASGGDQVFDDDENTWVSMATEPETQKGNKKGCSLLWQILYNKLPKLGTTHVCVCVCVCEPSANDFKRKGESERERESQAYGRIHVGQSFPRTCYYLYWPGRYVINTLRTKQSNTCAKLLKSVQLCADALALCVSKGGGGGSL